MQGVLNLPMGADIAGKELSLSIERTQKKASFTSRLVPLSDVEREPLPTTEVLTTSHTLLEKRPDGLGRPRLDESQSGDVHFQEF